MSLFVKMIRQKLATQHLSCMHFYRWDDGCGGDFSRELNMNHFYYKELNAVCPIWKLNKCFRWEWKIYWRPFTDYILDRLNEIVQQQKKYANDEQKERWTERERVWHNLGLIMKILESERQFCDFRRVIKK